MFNRKTLAIPILALIGACTAEPASVSPNPSANGGDPEVIATAELYDRSGQLVGSASFIAMQNGASIEVAVQNLPPGLHGFHIHETGACEGPEFESAGGHFNPLDADHGHVDGEPHLGDLPNLEVDGDGRAEVRVLAEGISLAPEGDRSVLAGDGTALVIHADPDDYRTDPAGAAGPRIACGVIVAR